MNDKYDAVETMRENWQLYDNSGKPTQDVAIDFCATRLSKLKDVAKVVGEFGEILKQAQEKDSAYVAENIINKCYRFDQDNPYFDITDMMDLASEALSVEAFTTDEEAEAIKEKMSNVATQYAIAAYSAIVKHKNNSSTWGAKSVVLSMDDNETVLDPAWSVNLFSQGCITFTDDELELSFFADGTDNSPFGTQGTWGSTFADTYGTLLFNKWSTTSSGYTWGQWLLDNKTAPTGNPCY